MLKSIRLTKTIRDRILTNVLEKFDKENNISITDLDMWYERKACEVYELRMKDIYKETKKYWDYMANDYVTVYISDRAYRVVPRIDYFTDRNIIEYIEKKRDVIGCPERLRCYDTKIEEQRQRFLAQEKERNLFIETIAGILSGVNTTKQLLEVWPECEDFIPKEIVDPSRVIFALQIDTSQVNKKLNIRKR